MRPTGRALTVALAGAALAGCGPSTAGTPTPADPTTSDPDEITIENPLDLAAVSGDSCALLTQAQLDGIGPGLVAAPDTTLWGEPRCNWNNDAIFVGVAPDTITGAGVDATLLQPGTDRVEVAGYPAARYGDSEGACTVSVGVAEDTELIVNFFKGQSQAPEHQQTCQFVDSVAAMVIANLPPQQ